MVHDGWQQRQTSSHRKDVIATGNGEPAEVVGKEVEHQKGQLNRDAVETAPPAPVHPRGQNYGARQKMPNSVPRVKAIMVAHPQGPASTALIGLILCYRRRIV